MESPAPDAPLSRLFSALHADLAAWLGTPQAGCKYTLSSWQLSAAGSGTCRVPGMGCVRGQG